MKKKPSEYKTYPGIEEFSSEYWKRRFSESCKSKELRPKPISAICANDDEIIITSIELTENQKGKK